MAELVGHTGGVHRWVTEMVSTRATERAPFAESPADWGARLEWFDDGLPALVEALQDVGPDEPVWNWAARAPAPARFWPRRMAHETAVHRWDAQHAADPATATPIDDELAIDGIDEYLGFVSGRAARHGLHATLGEDGALQIAHTTVRGSPSDLLLWLTGRLAHDDAPGLTVQGDEAALSAWEETVSF